VSTILLQLHSAHHTIKSSNGLIWLAHEKVQWQLLWIWYWTFWCHKWQKISRLAELLLTTAQGVCSMCSICTQAYKTSKHFILDQAKPT